MTQPSSSSPSIARREFLHAGCAAAVALAATSAAPAADAPPAGNRAWIELRTYHFASPDKLAAYEKFLASAGVAALNRAGVEPVGVFRLFVKDNAPLKLAEDPLDLYVLLPHKSADAAATLEARLAADPQYQQAFAAVAGGPKEAATYARYESQLMLAFSGFPSVQAPGKAESRILNLRIYESHNTERAAKKIAMFNEGGEIAIFKKTGMNAVFFGQTVAGAKMPNLTYMLSFDDEAAAKRAWDAFRADPDWKVLSKDESYKDTVSQITNMILRPAAGSQI